MMKHPAEANPTTDALPTFLDEAPEDRTEPMDAEAGDLEDLDEFAEHHDASDPAEDDDPHAGTCHVVERDAQAADGHRAGAADGTLLMVPGFAAVVLATLQGTALADSNLAMALARLGLTAGATFLIGVVLLTGALVLRSHARPRERDDGGADTAEWARSAQASLQFLVAAQEAQDARPPAAGEELQHVLIALQRLDEKVNNLTKAIKMYGKPLMEISGQTTDLTAAMAQTRATIEATGDATQQAFERLEAAREATQKAIERLEAGLGDDRGQKERAELLDALHVIASDVDKLTRKQVQVSLDPVQQQIGRVEVAVAALGQRLDHSDVQKSLLRLEETAQKVRDEVHQLRGDGLGKATTQLQERFDKATRSLTDGLAQLRDGNLGGLEQSVRELQRELSGVATTVAQIQAAVRSGAGRATAAVAASPAAAAPAAAPADAPAAAAAPAPASGRAPTPAPAAAGGKGSDDNPAYQTGARKTSSKNVLGAIAKLKQMKN